MKNLICRQINVVFPARCQMRGYLKSIRDEAVVLVLLQNVISTTTDLF